MSVDKNVLKDVTKETYRRKLAQLDTETLKDIEASVFSLYYQKHLKFTAPELGGHDLHTLLKLGRIIPEADKSHAVYSRLENEWQIWNAESDTVHIHNAERLLSVVKALLNGTEDVIELVKKKNGLYLAVDGKDYFVSERFDTAKSILLTSLFQPRLGTFKTAASIYSKTDNDNNKLLTVQVASLEGYLKEINRSLRMAKAPIRFKLKKNNQSVALIVKSGS
jgi:hypothetical protein